MYFAVDHVNAIIAAAAAVGGAFVGAVAGAMASYLIQRRGAKRAARAAARLLRSDFQTGAQWLTDAIGELLWWGFYDFSMKAWADHRELLAAELSTATWGLVEQSAFEFVGLGRQMHKSPGYKPDGYMLLEEALAENLANMRANAIRAFNALSEVADDPQQMELTDPPAPGSKPFTRSDAPADGSPGAS